MSHIAKPKIQELQRQVGAKDDGYWGENSQDSLLCSGYLLALDYDIIREELFDGSISQSQFAGLERLIKVFNEFNGIAINPLNACYMLATSYHETAHTMQPIKEYGRGRGRKYGRPVNGRVYYGRGDVQLTWYRNYRKMSKKLGVNLVSNPDLALVPEISGKIMLIGMRDGDFTTKSLSDYIKYGLDFEFVNARRIINGTDRDEDIAEYAQIFLRSIVLVR